MKNQKIFFVILVFLFLVYGQSAQALQQGSDGHAIIQRQASFLQSEAQNLRTQYNSILQKPKLNVMSLSGNLILPISESTPLSSTDSELSDLLTRGSGLFNQLDQQLETLQKQLNNSEITITGLRQLLSESQTTIMLLRENLNQVSERMQASNEWLAAAYDDIDLLEKQNADLKIKNEKLRTKAKHGTLFGFTFGGVSFGVGVPLLIEGARSDNQTIMWAGVGTLVGTGGIWALGHFLFNWW